MNVCQWQRRVINIFVKSVHNKLQNSIHTCLTSGTEMNESPFQIWHTQFTFE